MSTQEIKATIVDVRTPEEFRSGNIPGSYNIPLDELMEKLDAIRALKQPLILVCASGGRSGVACQLLAAQGISATNGGSWMSI